MERGKQQRLACLRGILCVGDAPRPPVDGHPAPSVRCNKVFVLSAANMRCSYLLSCRLDPTQAQNASGPTDNTDPAIGASPVVQSQGGLGGGGGPCLDWMLARAARIPTHGVAVACACSNLSCCVCDVIEWCSACALASRRVLKFCHCRRMSCWHFHLSLPPAHRCYPIGPVSRVPCPLSASHTASLSASHRAFE
jgi:hypothetical protein